MRAFAKTVLFLSLLFAFIAQLNGQDISSRPELKIPIGHLKKINAIDISPDNKFIATASSDNTVIIWDAATGSEARTILLPRPVYNVFFSKDGKYLFTASQNGMNPQNCTYNEWDAQTGEQIMRFPFVGQRESLSSRSGNYLLVKGFSEKPQQMSKNPFSGIVDQDKQGQVHLAAEEYSIWDLKKSQNIYTVYNPQGITSFISFNGLECLLTTGVNQVDPQKAMQVDTNKINEYRNKIEQNNNLATEKYEKAKMDDTATSTEYRKALENYNAITQKMKSFSDRISKTNNKDSIESYLKAIKGYQNMMMIDMNIINMETVKKNQKHYNDAFKDIGQQNAGLQNAMIAAYYPKAVKPTPIINLWDFRPAMDPKIISAKSGEAKEPKALHSFMPGYFVKLLAISPEDNLFSTSSVNGDLQIWDLNKDLAVVNFPKIDGEIISMEFSSNAKLLFTRSKKGNTQTITIWQIKNALKLSSVTLPLKAMPNVLKFSSDGRYFVMLGDEAVNDHTGIIYAANGKLIRKLELHANKVLAYYFSADGKYVYTDHGNKDVGEAKRKQYIDQMMVITQQLAKQENDNNEDTVKINSLYSQLNKQVKKQMDEVKQKTNIRVWDLNFGNVIDSSRSDIKFTKDSVSSDQKYELTSYIKRTGMKEQMGVLAQPILGDSSDSNDTEPHTMKDIMSKSLDKEFQGTGFNFFNELNNENSEMNRTFSQSTLLINKSKKDTISLIAIDSADWIMVNKEGYYMCSKNSARELRYMLNNKIYYFDQFDLQYNRPDKVLESIGIAPKEIIDAYKKAYEKRVAKMGLDPEGFGKDISLNAPEIKLSGVQGIYDSSLSKKYTFTLEAEDKKYPIKKINVLVNGVPENGTKSIELDVQQQLTIKKQINIELSSGKNIIDVSVINEKGVASLSERFEVEYTGPVKKPDLYVIAIGADKYVNTAMNLRYPAKDANDIIHFFTSDKKDFEHVNPYLFTGEKVNKENIIVLKNVLMRTKVDDRVIIFYAGHGLLDSAMDYYLGTYNIDLRDPSKEGLQYDVLENLFDGIPSREKILFVDACHAGEIDKSNLQVSEIKKEGQVNVVSRGVIIAKNKKTGLQNSFEVMRQLFTDIRRSTGATVISAAGGSEYAWEGANWNNGVFTYCLLTGLKEKKADLNNDGIISLSELKQYIQEQVSSLTNGKQNPTSRTENIVSDIKIW